MATELIRPSSNIATTWNGSGYTRINDAVTQPTSPSDITRPVIPGTSTTCVANNKNDDGEEDQYGLTAPATAGTMSQVDLWIFGERTKVNPGDSNPVFQTRVRLNGSWTSYANITSNCTPLDGSPENPSWTQYTWSVSGAAVGSAPAFALKAPASVANGEAFYVYCAYLVITTSGGGDTSNRIKRRLLSRFINP